MPKIHPTANIWGDAEIGERTKIGAFCDIGGCKIGRNCKIQCHVSIPPGITIGDDVFIGPGVHFANDKFPQARATFMEPELTYVGKGARIGMGALIGPSVNIGEHALIGMGAVVTKNVHAASIVVGNPAREI